MTVAVAEHSGRGVQAAGRAGHHETPAGGGSEGVHLHHGEDCQRHGQFSTPPLLGHCPAAVFLLFFARLCVLTDMVSSPLVCFGLLHCCRDFLCQALCFDTVSSRLFRFGLLHCCRNFLCQVLCFDRHGQFSTCPLWATALL